MRLTREGASPDHSEIFIHDASIDDDAVFIEDDGDSSVKVVLTDEQDDSFHVYRIIMTLDDLCSMMAALPPDDIDECIRRLIDIKRRNEIAVMEDEE